MIVERHNFKDRIILDLEKREFLLIAYLIEKSYNENKNKNFKEPIDKRIHFELQKFIDANINFLKIN